MSYKTVCCRPSLKFRKTIFSAPEKKFRFLEHTQYTEYLSLMIFWHWDVLQIAGLVGPFLLPMNVTFLFWMWDTLEEIDITIFGKIYLWKSLSKFFEALMRLVLYQRKFASPKHLKWLSRVWCQIKRYFEEMRHKMKMSCHIPPKRLHRLVKNNLESFTT